MFNKSIYLENEPMVIKHNVPEDSTLLMYDYKRLSNETVTEIEQVKTKKKLYETTMKRWREKARQRRKDEIFCHASLFETPVGVHFDGKSLVDIDSTSKKGARYERMAVLLSGT